MLRQRSCLPDTKQPTASLCHVGCSRGSSCRSGPSSSAPGRVRVSDWTCAFSVDRRTMPLVAGDHRLSPTTSRTSVDALRVVGELRSAEPGVAGDHARARCVELNSRYADGPAFIEAVQWVASTADRCGSARPHARIYPIRVVEYPSWSLFIAPEAVVNRLHEAFLPPPHAGFRNFQSAA